jgi:LysM repeat protein
MTMTLYVADKYVPTIGKPTAPTLKFTADAVARQLTTWANNGTRLRVEYGSFENGTWRITSISTRSIQRGWETNNFTVAEITLTFTEVVDMKVGTGPVSGGTRAKTSNKKATKSPTRTYTVRKGDTLTKISQKYYGTASKWRKIADANKIKNPNKIRIGQKLKIPK